MTPPPDPALSTECAHDWCRDCAYGGCRCICHPPNGVRVTSITARSPGVSTRERVYAAVVEHHEGHGLPPTVRELAAATGMGVSTVAHHVDVLVRAGRLTRRPGLVRTLTPVRQATPAERSA